MTKEPYNELYDAGSACPTCLGTSEVCTNCEGTEGPDPDDPDNNCECVCSVYEPVACLDCDGLGYLSEDDESDDDDEETDEDSEEDTCPDCLGTGEVESDDGSEILDCDCIDEELDDE